MTILIRIAKVITLGLWVVAILWAGRFTSVTIYAQVAGATLSGTVTDSSGATIPNAQVSIRNTATGVERDLTADSAGFYSAPNLLPGTYDVTFSAPGFAKLVQPNLTLEVGGQQQLNPKMQIGQVTQTVEVTTEAPTVQLTSSALSAEVTSTTMRELPLNGRDWTQLATLQPGVLNIRTQAPTGGAAPRSNRGFGNQVAAVGHRPYENNYRVDGVSVNDYSNGSPGSVLGVQLGVDAISEFSVLTSNYSSEYGRTSGGVINAITKSGTNAFHGSAYWFLRDEGLDAKNFFDIKKPPFHRNQFGASGGAPIIKNKTFVFVDYEGIRQDKSLSFHDKVPSPAARGIGANGQPAVAVINGSPLPASGAGAAPNPDPATHIDTAVLPYLALWPLPNAGLVGNGDVGFFNGAGAAVVSENYVTSRVDHTVSSKDNLAASWFIETSSILQPDALLLSTTAAESKRYMGNLEENHIFSATLTNTARFGFNRSVGIQAHPGTALNPLADNTSLGILPGHNVPQIGVPGIATESGGLNTPPYNIDVENSFQVYDDVFVTHGKHSLKFGFAWEHVQYNSQHRGIFNGVYSFPSLMGFLTNHPTSLNLLFPNLPAGLGAGTKEIGVRQNAFGGYVQDDWRALPNLTVNLGLRYEPVTLPTEVHNLFMGLTSLTAGAGGPVSMAHTWQTNQTLKNFEPRIGFAWDPFHDGKTSVRAGIGIFDVLPLPWETVFNQATSFPFSVRGTVGGLAVGSFPTGAVSALAFNPSKIQVAYFDQNPKRNYAMNWNFNIQRQITPTLTATLGYAGSHTVHQPFMTGATNTVLPTLTSAGYLWPFPVGSGTKLNPAVNVITSATSDDSAHYHGLQAEIVKNMSHGLQFQGSYTFSKCIDYGSSGHITDPFENSQPDMFYFNSAGRRGLCDFDQRHNFVGNVVWMLPTPKFAGAAGEYVLGGWELGGIFTASSGMPTTATIAGDPLGSGISGTQLPDRLSGPGCSNPVNPGNINNYFNLSCFSPPVAPASFAGVCNPAAASVAAVIPNTCMNLLGNEARNSVIGPRLTEVDFSMFKDIPIHKISEAFHVQFRAEFFNILNHPNFQVPNQGGDGNTDIFNQDGTTVAGAGAIASMATDPREIQFGLKVIW